MEPFFSNNDKVMFYKYLDKASNYLEYGTGGSTYQASIRKNIKTIYSVESDKDWYNKLEEKLKEIPQCDKKINIIYCDMNAQKNNWGYPGPKSNIHDWKNYSDQLVKMDPELQKDIDLILIDGRFRVACCLKCFDIINDNCLIIFDDFLDRQDQFGVVLDYYDIVEKTNDNKMAILKKKNCNSPSSELIKIYENDPR